MATYTSLFDAADSKALMTSDKYGRLESAIKNTANAQAQLKLFEEAKATFPKGHDVNGVPLARQAEADYFNKNPKLKETLDAIYSKAEVKDTGRDHSNILDVAKDLRRPESQQLGKMTAVKGDHGPEPSDKAREVVQKEKSSSPHNPDNSRQAPSSRPAPQHSNTPPRTTTQGAAVAGFHGDSHTPHMTGAHGRHGNQMDVALESIRRGDSMGVVGKEVGKAAAFAIPVVGPALEGRYAEAAIQLVSRVTAIPAALAGPVGTTAHAAAEFGARQLLKEQFHLNVNGGSFMQEAGLRMAEIAQEAIRRNPMPPALMAANTHALAMQTALLKDTNLPDFKLPDGKCVPGVDLLRNPQTRDLYVASLADDVKSGKAKPEQLAAAEQFRDIEKNRLAKLAPYTEKLSAELAAIAQAHGQQPATQVANKPHETDPVKQAALGAVSFKVPPQDAASTHMNATGGRQQQVGGRGA